MRQAEKGCLSDDLFTSTNLSNIPAQRLFEKLDYTRTVMVENLDEGDPEIFYFKRLRVAALHGVAIQPAQDVKVIAGPDRPVDEVRLYGCSPEWSRQAASAVMVESQPRPATQKLTIARIS